MKKLSQQRYALVSVFDKTNLVELANTFLNANITLIASGGTAKFLAEHQIAFTPIEKITNSPESFEGRMKTISFQVASGILFDRNKKLHQQQAKDLAIPPIDFVVCNFYPFWEKPSIELIDVGGPTMVRAAAKNYDSVTVLVDQKDYQKVISELNKESQTTKEARLQLAEKAFSYVTAYDAQISTFFQEQTNIKDTHAIVMGNGRQLRYGENPHQQAYVYQEINDKDTLSLEKFQILQGKAPSCNNLLDLHAAVETLCFIGKKDPACVIIKHNNPCGAAVATTTEKAFDQAWNDGDPLAAFGGILAVNRPVDEKVAMLMLSNKRFFEILAAPSYTKEALAVFAKKPKLQLYQNPHLKKPFLLPYEDVKRIRGGYVLQDGNIHELTKKDLRIVTKKKPTTQQLEDMLFAWKICQVSKSNCVVAAKETTLLASGVGQQDRKRCCELCVTKAIKPLKGAVAATDGFFPFSDGPEVLIKAGITAIIQPGGSIRDQETIDLCNKNCITMIMAGLRTFKH